jgi:hypothetical protein
MADRLRGYLKRHGKQVPINASLKKSMGLSYEFISKLPVRLMPEGEPPKKGIGANPKLVARPKTIEYALEVAVGAQVPPDCIQYKKWRKHQNKVVGLLRLKLDTQKAKEGEHE